jgi:PAS domain S-box-containing protein
VKHKFNLQFFLFISLCLGFYLVGSRLFYQKLVKNITSNLQYEHVLVAERIRDNVESHLERVARTIDSTLTFHDHGNDTIRLAIADRFHLLQTIYPEIGNLALAAENKIFFSDKKGFLQSVGMPVSAVYEWTQLKQKFWWQVPEGQSEATVMELFQFVPEVDRIVHLPAVLFAKKVIINKLYYGTILIPYQLEFMVSNFLRSMESEGKRPVALISDQGLVLYSSIGKIRYSQLLPAFSPLLSKEQCREQCSLVEAEFLPMVIEKLKKLQSFHCCFALGNSENGERYEGFFSPVNLGGTTWTVMVGSPLPGPYTAINQVFFPLFWGMLGLVVVIGLVTFWLFRQTSIYWKGLTVFKRATENSGDGIYIADLDGLCIYANQAYGELVGYKPAELVGRKISEIQQDVSPENIQKAVHEAIASGKRWHGIVRLKSQDQQVMELSQSIWPIVQYQKIVGYACSQLDITEEQQMKQQLEIYSQQLEEEVKNKTRALVQSQKMETVGLLAAGFAHDFNNLLAGIYGNIQLLELSTAKESEKSRKYVAKLKDISNRAAELVRRILEFSRKGQGVVANNSIGQIIRESVELASHSLPKNVSISFKNDAEGSIIQVEKAQIMQVLMNIMINARDAIGSRPDGHINIISKQRNLGKLAADRLNLKMPGRYVEISINDNGPGIPKNLIDRVFDPFFSTKEWSDSKGTGIGLSIVYTVIHNYEGTVLIDSKEGQGATFRIFLPCADGAITRISDDVGPEMTVQLEDKTILIIEDEADVRDSLHDLLVRHGTPRVLLAENGRQGQVIIYEQSPDIIILDLNMPMMSGEMLLSEMKEEMVDIPVIVMTGLSRDGYMMSVELPMVKAVLQKPFNHRSLLYSLSSALSTGD